MTAIDIGTIVPTPATRRDVSFELTGVPWPGDWARNGRCRTVPGEVFFPGRGDPDAHAKAVCRLCPVQAECAEYAIPHYQLQGVWGGLSARERQRIRRQRERQPRVIEAPRSPTAGRGTLDRHLEQLLDHPGVWARVVTYPSAHSGAAVAPMLHTGRHDRPPGRWQFEGRLTDEGGSALYARYDGPVESSQELGGDEAVVA